MKILLIHKFHYMLGGTETFHYNLAEISISENWFVVIRKEPIAKSECNYRL